MEQSIKNIDIFTDGVHTAVLPTGERVTAQDLRNVSSQHLATMGKNASEYSARLQHNADEPAVDIMDLSVEIDHGKLDEAKLFLNKLLNLPDLPADLIVQQLSYLEPNDVKSLCGTNKRIREICTSSRYSNLWKNLIDQVGKNNKYYNWLKSKGQLTYDYTLYLDILKPRASFNEKDLSINVMVGENNPGVDNIIRSIIDYYVEAFSNEFKLKSESEVRRIAAYVLAEAISYYGRSYFQIWAEVYPLELVEGLWTPGHPNSVVVPLNLPLDSPVIERRLPSIASPRLPNIASPVIERRLPNIASPPTSPRL